MIFVIGLESSHDVGLLQWQSGFDSTHKYCNMVFPWSLPLTNKTMANYWAVFLHRKTSLTSHLEQVQTLYTCDRMNTHIPRVCADKLPMLSTEYDTLRRSNVCDTIIFLQLIMNIICFFFLPNQSHMLSQTGKFLQNQFSTKYSFLLF